VTFFSKTFGLSMNKMDKNGFGKLFQVDLLVRNGFFDKIVALTMLRRGIISQGERDLVVLWNNFPWGGRG
jgi:hypothetical protein